MTRNAPHARPKSAFSSHDGLLIRPRKSCKPLSCRGFLGGVLERVKGIEPSYSAWKAAALPLSYTRAQAIN